MIPRISSTSLSRLLPRTSALSAGNAVERNTALRSAAVSFRKRLLSGRKVSSIGSELLEANYRKPLR